jgi:hypothetical protein
LLQCRKFLEEYLQILEVNKDILEYHLVYVAIHRVTPDSGAAHGDSVR